MNAKQLLRGTIVIWIVANILDWLLHGLILKSTYDSITGMVCSTGINPGWFVLGDLIMAFLFTWFYGRVQAGFEKSPKGAMMYGLILAIVVSIPGNMYLAIMVNGFPYWLSWAVTLATIIQFSIYGYILGMLTKTKSTTA